MTRLHKAAKDMIRACGETIGAQTVYKRQFYALKDAVNDASDLEERITAALDLAAKHGQEDGAHHKAWVIDKMVKALTGEGYEAFIASFKYGEDGPETYSWDEGVTP